MSESSIFGVSIRAYIVFMLVTAFVVLTFMGKEIDSTFTTLVVAVVMFYFGNKSSTPTSTISKEVTSATTTSNATPGSII